MKRTAFDHQICWSCAGRWGGSLLVAMSSFDVDGVKKSRAVYEPRMISIREREHGEALHHMSARAMGRPSELALCMSSRWAIEPENLPKRASRSVAGQIQSLALTSPAT